MSDIADQRLRQLATEIQREHIALQDDERKLASAETKVQSMRDACAQRRLEIGRRLIEAKKAIKHGGWLAYLETVGISQQRDSEWRRLAEFQESQSKAPTFSNDGTLTAPTLRDAGIDKRPRKPRDQRGAVQLTRDFVRRTRAAMSVASDSSYGMVIAAELRALAADCESAARQLVLDLEGAERTAKVA